MSRALTSACGFIFVLGCTGVDKNKNPDVLEGYEGADEIREIFSLVEECRKKYDKYFLQELCVHQGREKYDKKHYISEVAMLADKLSSTKYTYDQISKNEKIVSLKIKDKNDDCLEAQSDRNADIEYQCYVYAMHSILSEEEKALTENYENNDRKSESLFVYFYVLNIWLNAI